MEPHLQIVPAQAAVDLDLPVLFGYFSGVCVIVGQPCVRP